MQELVFSPGPAAVFPSLAQHLQTAYSEGWLSTSHRGSRFDNLSRQTLELLRERLQVPADYLIFYVGSATECWEIIAQSLTRHKSAHFYNGSFGQKWFEYAQALRPASVGQNTGINQALSADQAIDADTDVICLTQNETSNATQVPADVLRETRQRHPDKLIAIDATSSMNGLALPIAEADIWFASVQKCFGLPAGLALMICSPKAMATAHAINENQHYNSLLRLEENIKKYQTSYTPSVLHIFLLNRVLHELPALAETHRQTQLRATAWYDLIENHPVFRPLILDKALRSETVIAVEMPDAESLARVYADAAAKGIILGRGYGKWKPSTFRIANFPALTDADVARGMDFLARWR